jgi:alpha-N-arabinofuranosidase
MPLCSIGRAPSVRALVVLALLAPAMPSAAAASAPQTSAAVRIDVGRDEGAISPLLYGQFAEFMFEGVKGGMYAELLRDRGFEDAPNAIGLPRYWERDPDDRDDDPALVFGWDDSVAYPEKPSSEREAAAHSLRVDILENEGRRRGFYQSGVPVRAGVAYRAYLWIKTTGYEGRVTVALERDDVDGERYASAEIASVSGDWRKYEVTLTPTESDPLAKFAVLFPGRGRLWVDQASLVPGDAVGDVRADVAERVRALRPAFIRWPGGNVAQDYHWMWGVGPRDARTTWVNLAWRNEAEPSDFGTDEFVAFCRIVGAEPSITVNVEGRGATAEEAAAWVEYCNGPATSKYGRMRAANGHPEPFGVKYWEVGNEIWGDWVRGHSDAETYARNYNRYQAAMRAVDPTIKLVGCGDNDMAWNRTVLRIAGSHMDYLAIHHYYGFPQEVSADPLNLMARPLHYERFYGEMRRLVAELVPGRDLRLAVNEWNTALPLARQHSMESAIYGARLMNVFERTGDFVAMSAVSDMVNGWSGGVIQASRRGVFVTPTYLVNALYSGSLGARRVAASVEGPTFDTKGEGREVPVLDVVASRSADGGTLIVKAVNTGRERPLRATLTISGAAVGARAEVRTVSGASPAAVSSFATPDAISVRESTVSAGPSFVVDLPAYSVSVITVPLGR